MKPSYEKYVENVTDDIRECLEGMGCQPVLFIGSGLTKRYMNAPNWEELLIQLSQDCPEINKKYAYYKQNYNDPIDIGSIFSEKFNNWAWSNGEDQFPKELYEPNTSPDIYLKYWVSHIFNKIMSDNELLLQEETELLKMIHPHSVITTNYDQFLERVFPDYEVVVGQKILRSNNASIGEIFKIHGCSSFPKSLVINRNDYDEFLKKKKYLSAKLLTFFAEHPLIFVGYSAEDPNIRAILSDIDEILSENGDLIPNIYILEWSKNEPIDYPRTERLIQVSENKSVRIKSIVASDFSWVYKAFGSNDALKNFKPKLLRSLLARTYELVRSDIPKSQVQVDYSVLSKVYESDNELATLFGIANAAESSSFNHNYPFTLKSLGKALGYKGWHDAQKLLTMVKDDKGIDIKSFDNIYHCAIMNGDSVQTHRYSNALKNILLKVISGEPFELEVTK